MGKRNRSGSSFETTIELDENEVEVTVVYNWSPGSPGKTYGPPEDCYPPEGPEVEVEAVFRSDDKTETDISSKLSKETMQHLEDQCAEAGEEAANDAYEAAMEDKAEAARKREWDRD